jgi:plastocyanin
VTIRRLVVTSLAVLAVGVASTVVVGEGAASLFKAKTKTAKVCGDYFTPTALRIKKGSKVRWKWAACGTPDVHDVTLRKGPRGVKKSRFRSQTAPAPSDYRFTKRFKKVGKYRFYCTVHPDVMRMKVVVHR